MKNPLEKNERTKSGQRRGEGRKEETGPGAAAPSDSPEQKQHGRTAFKDGTRPILDAAKGEHGKGEKGDAEQLHGFAGRPLTGTIETSSTQKTPRIAPPA